jgi:putative MATE family efflux protein
MPLPNIVFHLPFGSPARKRPPGEPAGWNDRSLFRLIWPLIIEQLLAVTMGAADTVMVSSVGEFAVSGVNIVDNINNFLIIAFTALAAGGAVVTSQYIGRQDRVNSSFASKQLIYIVTILSLGIMIFVIPLRRVIIRLLYGNIAPMVMKEANLYLFITAMSYPFLAIYNGCAALYRASGNSKVPMGIALLVNIINVGGNAFFIFVLHIGVGGAALSTLLSRIIAAAVLMVLLIMNRRSPISLAGLERVRLNRKMINNIFNVGIPGAMENSMFQVGRLLSQRIFTFFGTAAMAGNAIASVVNSFSFMPGMAFGMALITVVGQCIGAGDYEGAKKQTAKIMKAGYITLFLISLLNYIFMEPLISLFNLSAEAHNLAKGYLRIHCITMGLFWGVSFMLPNALRAAGDARFVMWVAAISMWVVRVNFAYLLTFFFKLGSIGVWIAMGMDFVSRGTFYTVRWFRGKWKEKKVIKE